MVYFGAHPNCESLYVIASDGEKYRPIEYYLKQPLPELARAFLKLEDRLTAREKRWEGSFTGRVLSALHLKNFALKALGITQAFFLLLSFLRLGRVLKGRGPMKVAHAVALPFDLLFSGHKSEAARRHLLAQDPIPVVILPLEDTPILETSRLQRCPSAHVVYDPRSETFSYVPVCSWRMVNKKLLGEVADTTPARRTRQAPQTHGKTVRPWRIVIDARPRDARRSCMTESNENVGSRQSGPS